MILVQIPPRNAVSGRFTYRALGMELGDAIGLVRKLKCSTLRRAENILRCTHQAQYVSKNGTQQAHVPDVCTYCGGARHSHSLKVWTIFCPAVVVAPYNSIPINSAMWLKLKMKLGNHENLQKSPKIEKMYFFKKCRK